MKTKQTFRLFIYFSILLHVLGGAFYYYKKNSFSSSFSFFKSKKTLVLENEKNALVPPILENSPQNPSSAAIKEPASSKEILVSKPEIKSLEPESASGDLPEMEFQKINLPKENEEEFSTLKETAVTKIRTEGADFVISRVDPSKKFLQSKEKPLTAKETPIETEEAGQFSGGVNLSKEPSQDKNAVWTLKGQVEEVEKTDHLSVEVDQLQELSEEIKEPLKIKEGIEEMEKIETQEEPLKAGEKTREMVENTHSSEEVDRLEKLLKDGDKPSTVKNEEIIGETQINKEEKSIEQEDSLPTTQEIEDSGQKPSVRESITEDTLKEPSDTSEVDSSLEKTMDNKQETSLFRNFLNLKQKPGNPALSYPLKARRIKAQGSLSLIFYVTAEGLVEKIQIESSSGHRDLDNSVMRTFARYQFLPQQEGWVRHKVNFILKGENVEFLKLRTK